MFYPNIPSSGDVCKRHDQQNCCPKWSDETPGNRGWRGRRCDDCFVRITGNGTRCYSCDKQETCDYKKRTAQEILSEIKSNTFPRGRTWGHMHNWVIRPFESDTDGSDDRINFSSDKDCYMCANDVLFSPIYANKDVFDNFGYETAKFIVDMCVGKTVTEAETYIQLMFCKSFRDAEHKRYTQITRGNGEHAAIDINGKRLPVPPQIANNLYEKANNACQLCGWTHKNRRGLKLRAGLTIHHIQPVLAEGGGGNHNPDNLIVLCRTCHALYHAGEITKQELINAKESKNPTRPDLRDANGNKESSPCNP